MSLFDGLLLINFVALVWVGYAHMASRYPRDAGAANVRQQAMIVDLNAEIEKSRRTESELREAKDAAELANYAKTQFLANMSHELRTPLNAMIGFAELMSNELKGPIGTPIYKEYAADIHAGGQHLFTILSDILDMARLDAGKTRLAETEFDIANTLKAVLRLSNDDVRGTGKTLTFSNPKFSAMVRADERLVRKIVMNLVSNAVKYTGADGRVVIGLTKSASGGIELTVTDNGVGIAPEKLDLIMQRFGQVEEAFVRAQGGIGLGLPLAKGLIELHGGTLVLESQVGGGTKVYVHFPAYRTMSVIKAVG